jgi:hypothetical protein
MNEGAKPIGSLLFLSNEFECLVPLKNLKNAIAFAERLSACRIALGLDAAIVDVTAPALLAVVRELRLHCPALRVIPVLDPDMTALEVAVRREGVSHVLFRAADSQVNVEASALSLAASAVPDRGRAA